VPVGQPAICALMSVILRLPTNTSATEEASERRHARVLLSCDSEQPDVTLRSIGSTFAIARVATSSRYRYAYVRSLAAK